MASHPAPQPSQPQATREQTTSRTTSQTQPAQSPVRTRSEDSQTVFLNSPTEEATPQQEQKPAPPSASPVPSTEEVKKCWICFSDSTEDTPETSPWRNPCPCALTAHEECLLDWIADTESPTNSRRARSVAAPKIECPQCKSEIRLARPRNLVVEAVRGVERLGTQMVTPGAVTVLLGTVYTSSLAWGVHSIYAIFGADDGFRILRPLLLSRIRPPLEFDSTARQIGDRVLGITVDHLVHWRLYLGLPLITPILILSRSTLADSILPILPIVFFATQTPSPTDTLDFTSWPPSASLSFAVLPYLRIAYNAAYRRIFGAKEMQWLREIQPRAGQAQAEGNGAANDAAQEQALRERDDGNIFEVRIDGGLWEDWEDEEDNEAPAEVPAAEPAPMQFPGVPEPAQQDPPEVHEGLAAERPQEPEQQPPNANAEAVEQPAPEPQQAAADPAPAAGGNERRLSFSPTTIAESVLGALLFPTLASLSGEILKLALPQAWTAPLPSSTTIARGGLRISKKGLLQEKWGRSLVGGCCFVVLKDLVGVYVRWKMAEMHKRRRVVDYNGKSKGKA